MISVTSPKLAIARARRILGRYIEGRESLAGSLIAPSPQLATAPIAVDGLSADLVVPVTLEVLPSATRFARGETLRLDVQGRWFFRRHPLRGQFPVDYAPSGAGTCALHTGGAHDAHLLVPWVAV